MRLEARARRKTKSSKTNNWRRSMANGWTAERRARQSRLIRGWRPWGNSTGPKTPEGKSIVSMNAYKGGTWRVLRELRRLLRRQEEARREAEAQPRFKVSDLGGARLRETQL